MNKDIDQQMYKMHLDALHKQFETDVVPDESDEDIGKAILEVILKGERLRRGVDISRHADVDRETLKKLETWDSNDPNMDTVEKVFKRLSNDRYSDAVNHLKAAIESKQREISEQQRKRASKPRKKNPVTLLIEQIVETKPNISEKELLQELEKHMGGSDGVIQDIDEELIFPSDESCKPIKLSGLKDHLSRAKNLKKTLTIK